MPKDPLCLQFAPSGVTVVGLDIDPANEVYRQPWNALNFETLDCQEAYDLKTPMANTDMDGPNFGVIPFFMGLVSAA
jgi:hypothetical protein